MACNKYYLILYSYAILQHKNSNFSHSNDLYSCAIFWKKIWLKFRIHAKFRAKNIYFEWMRNFVLKKSFRAKPRNCCARESTVSWKPYFWETEGPRVAISLLMLPQVYIVNEALRCKPLKTLGAYKIVIYTSQKLGSLNKKLYVNFKNGLSLLNA